MTTHGPTPARKLTEFDRVASRLLESSNTEARGNIRRLLAFISNTPLLAEAVSAAPKPTPFTASDLRNALYTGDFELPTQPLEELGMAVTMMEVIAADPDSVSFFNYTLNLPPITDGDAQAREFMRRYIHPSLLSLRQVLVDAVPTPEPQAPFAVNVVTNPGGVSQTNIAQHHASITAYQDVVTNLTEIRSAAERLLEATRRFADQVPEEERQDLEQFGALVLHEVSSKSPQASRLRWLGSKLMRIVDVINSTDAVYQAGSALVRLLLNA